MAELVALMVKPHPSVTTALQEAEEAVVPSVLLVAEALVVAVVTLVHLQVQVLQSKVVAEVLLRQVSQQQVEVALDLQDEIIMLPAEQVLEDQVRSTLNLLVLVDHQQDGLQVVVVVDIFHLMPLTVVLVVEVVEV
jgi:hypothetical protein